MTWLWIILLQILAVGLLTAEVFLPSMGVLAAATVAALGGSLWLGWSSGWPFWILLVFDLVAFPWLAKALLGRIDRSPMGLPQRLETGGSASVPDVLAGALGIAETDFRPAGKARFQDRVFDAAAIDGQFLLKGTRLVATGTDQNRLSVRAAREDETSSALETDS